MNRPVFPDIQFVSAQNKFQIQTMVECKSNTEENIKYYIPVLDYSEINKIFYLQRFVENFNDKAKRNEMTYVIREDDDLLYKVTEDGIN
jgi:hypothetical protein